MDPDQLNSILGGIDKLGDKVSNLHGDFREFRGIMSTKVEALEGQAKSDRMWNRIQTVAVVPLIAAIHAAASKYGFIK
jgi:hypothetical protein